MKKILRVFLAALFLCMASVASAQQTSTTTTGVRRGVAVVMFAGLAGAVLGLSTLSFYGEPQEHINNIWTGLAVGVVVGGAYVFSQASKSNTTSTEIQWPTNPHQVAKISRPLVHYQWSF